MKTRKRRVPVVGEVIVGRPSKTGWTKEQAESLTKSLKADPKDVTGVYIAQSMKSKYSPFHKEVTNEVQSEV
jgi:K+-sensing histidine kinase KdpD